MAHLALDKQTRRQYLKAKRRIALGVGTTTDQATITNLYNQPAKQHKPKGVNHGTTTSPKGL